MTREHYLRMTSAVRRATDRIGGAGVLRLPTLLCASVYIFTLLFLALTNDTRLVRALLVPAGCFLVVTLLRPLIGKQRPYDRFLAEPVGAYLRGKGKSMPSRHAASAAAIACAVVYVFPTLPVALSMLLLATLIAALRVLSGQHDPEDVIAALILSFSLSLLGYLL